MLNIFSKRGVRQKGRIQKARPMSPRLERQKVKRRGNVKKSVSFASFKTVGGVVFRVLAMGLIAFGLTGGLLTAYAALSQAETFTVKEADIKGVNKLSRLDILRQAKIGSNSNLLALYVGGIEKRLTKLPWVRSASVVRSLPHTVRIYIEEYKPRQLALVENNFYYLDAEMRAFAPMKSAPVSDLPVVTGLSKADLMDPDEEIRALMDASKNLLDLLPLLKKNSLSEIHLDRVWGVSLVFSDIAPTIRLGSEGFKNRLARLIRVMADLKRRNEFKRVLLIDLTDENRVVVRLRGDTA